MAEKPLTSAEVEVVAEWFATATHRMVVHAWHAAGFTTIYSMIGWEELARTMPDVAVALGRSIITRYGLHP